MTHSFARSALTLAFSMLTACTSGSMMGDDGGDPMMPDAPPSTSTLDPADCAALAANAVDAQESCGGSVPGGGQMALQTFCERGIGKAAMCGGNPAAGLDCFAQYDASDWACYAGDAYPACNGDLAAALGAYCLLALGNPQCASGIACQYDADCSSGMKCNGATEQCVAENAYCVGLPCQYDADCPTGQKCNGAESACVMD